MTDETVLDGNQQEPGEKGSQPPSSTPGGQLSPDVTALQERLDKLEKLYTGVQKGTDKVNARVEKKVTDLSAQIERIAELAKAGKSQSEIEERLVLDEIIRERKGSGFSEQPEGTGARGQGQVDVQEIAKQLNLDMNDKDIADAVATGNLVNVMKVAMSKASTPSPGPEDAQPLLKGAARKSEKTPQQLQSEYEKARDQIAQNYRGDAKVKALADLKVKFREEGLQV